MFFLGEFLKVQKVSVIALLIIAISAMVYDEYRMKLSGFW
jgi:hypothetical protein